MKKTVLKVKSLNKIFKIEKKKSGFKNRLKSIFNAEYEIFEAVKDLNLEIGEGEKVAFLGPNGAGKSTTLKMFTGILSPTNGDLDVLGYNPEKDRKKLVYEIGAVFGQISRLWYHLTPKDTFELMGNLFKVEETELEKRLEFLIEKFEVNDILNKPVRKLSLGQRMKCEIITSLVHSPKLLFLDEPTIGLDIIAKEKLRDTINSINKTDNTTIVLTSHDIADVEDICDRVVIINHGKIIFDDSIESLKKNHIKTKILKIKSPDTKKISENKNLKIKTLNPLSGTLKKDSYLIAEIKNDKIIIKDVFTKLMNNFDIEDISIEEPSMESIIKSFY